MRRAIDFFAPAGVFLGLVAFLVSRSERGLPGGLQPYLIAAAVLVLAHVVLRWEEVAALLGGRSARYGTNTAVAVLVVLGILGAINWFAARYPKRLDLTKGQRYSLSDQTKKIVSGLKDEVKVTYFQRERDFARGRERLKDYEILSDKLKVELVDPVKQPGKAKAFDVKGPWPVLVVERGETREKLTNDSEQDLTNALIKVTRDRKKTVCFQEGEGERDLDAGGEGGFTGAKCILAKSQYETKKVLLLREKAVPADCTVFVVASPEKDLLPDSISVLREFVKGGGKLFVLSGAPLKSTTPGLEALLKEWNLELGKDVVVDISATGQVAGASEFAPTVISYPFHEITKDFTKDLRFVTAFPLARSVQAGTATVEGVTAQNLLETDRNSWAETDLALKNGAAYDEGKDRKGPISLGAVATVRGKAPTPAPSPTPGKEGEEPPKAPEGRVVVIGSADFAGNAYLAFFGNQDLFLNVVSWLAQDPDLISIRGKEPDDQKMILSLNQKQNVGLVALLVLPGLFVVLGIRTWWRRR